MASPHRRLPANVPGDFYVDDSCIDCGACRWLAPDTFDARDGASRVHNQPQTARALAEALKALVACPTASIGTTVAYDVRSAAARFPEPVADGVYYCGYHHKNSYGAASYLLVRAAGNILVDSPRYTPALLKGIDALGGVQYMFLTHQDDVADHTRFARRYGCQRIMHRDDLGPDTRDVEIVLDGPDALEFADDVTLIPTPGHTRGSTCLLYRDSALFSGDHLAWSRSRRRLYAFRDACWYDWDVQARSMLRLADLRFERVLPGHGAPCHLDADAMAEEVRRCAAWMTARAEAHVHQASP